MQLPEWPRYQERDGTVWCVWEDGTERELGPLEQTLYFERVALVRELQRVRLSRMVVVLSEFLEERIRQDEKWGGPEHDDQHNVLDWCDFIAEHAGRARTAAGNPTSVLRHVAAQPEDSWREQMVRVGALAAAAIESYDRRTRAGG